MLLRKVWLIMLLFLLTAGAVVVACPCESGKEGRPAATAQTNPRIWTNKADYAPGETVIIFGQGFEDNQILTMRVTRPDGAVDKGIVMADGDGSFTYLYELDGIIGEYLVEAVAAKEVLATTSFTDGGWSVTVYDATLAADQSSVVLSAKTTHDGWCDPHWDWDFLICPSTDCSSGCTLVGTAYTNTTDCIVRYEWTPSPRPAPGEYGIFVRRTDFPNDSRRQGCGILTVEEPICTPPTITCPGNITRHNDQGECSAVVTWSDPIVTGDPTPTVSCTPASGSTFPVGTTSVTCTATNPCGTATCTFTVTVEDTEDPVISGCPSDITVDNDSGKCGAVVTWDEPTASDNCGIESFTSNYEPGDYFPVGTTTVTYTATDIHGNTAECSFKVTVNDTQPPTDPEVYHRIL